MGDPAYQAYQPQYMHQGAPQQTTMPSHQQAPPPQQQQHYYQPQPVQAHQHPQQIPQHMMQQQQHLPEVSQHMQQMPYQHQQQDAVQDQHSQQGGAQQGDEYSGNPIPMTQGQLAALLETIAKLDAQGYILEPGVMIGETGQILNLSVIRSKVNTPTYTLPEMLVDLNSICEPFLNQGPEHAQYATRFLDQANQAIVDAVREAQMASAGMAPGPPSMMDPNGQPVAYQDMQAPPPMPPQQQQQQQQGGYVMVQDGYGSDGRGAGHGTTMVDQAGGMGQRTAANSWVAEVVGEDGQNVYMNGQGGGHLLPYQGGHGGQSNGVVSPDDSAKKKQVKMEPKEKRTAASAGPRPRLEGRRCQVCAVIKKAGCGTENAHFRCLKKKKPDIAIELEKRVGELKDVGEEERVTVWNPKEGRKLSGQAAPMLKNLAGWLASHPGWEAHPRVTTSKSRQGEVLDGSPQHLQTQQQLQLMQQPPVVIQQPQTPQPPLPQQPMVEPGLAYQVPAQPHQQPPPHQHHVHVDPSQGGFMAQQPPMLSQQQQQQAVMAAAPMQPQQPLHQQQQQQQHQQFTQQPQQMGAMQSVQHQAQGMQQLPMQQQQPQQVMPPLQPAGPPMVAHQHSPQQQQHLPPQPMAQVMPAQHTVDGYGQHQVQFIHHPQQHQPSPPPQQLMVKAEEQQQQQQQLPPMQAQPVPNGQPDQGHELAAQVDAGPEHVPGVLADNSMGYGISSWEQPATQVAANAV